ncbi:hypothetical protein BDW22DRAFT_947905 [Trametopsis cervina]|nr:hypothetical protein BDW22DRAFT_947905 [Trametopsis cervina]
MPPTYCPCPRPILKRPSADKQHSAQPLYYSSPPNPQNDLLHIDPSVLGQPTVRFPPQATLVTRTFLAHPKSLYDRSPIVVAPNECRMPERGCPGRTYLPAPAASPSSSSASSSSKSSRGRDHSPARRGRSPRARNGAMPPLVPDLTSSSDESDGLVSPPVETDSAIGEHSSPPSTPLFFPRPRMRVRPTTCPSLSRCARSRKSQSPLRHGSHQPHSFPYHFAFLP